MKPLDQQTIIDITPTINARLAVFPGDTPFREKFALDIKKGDHITLSNIETTVHLGAHTDAPSHYAQNGESMETRPLSYYLGPVQVIEVIKPQGSRLLKNDIAAKPILAPRVLFKTLSFANPYEWQNDFNALSSELIEYLAQKKVCLVGLDTPSIDPADDKILESHQSVAKNNMAILEGIVLDHVSEGVYQLFALPLKIEGADASPVRAILMKE